MPLRLAILALPALALVPTIAPPRAPRAAQLFSVVERGTSSLEDTEGLGAEFEDALVDDAAWDTEESGDEDLLAGFDLEGAAQPIENAQVLGLGGARTQVDMYSQHQTLNPKSW